MQVLSSNKIVQSLPKTTNTQAQSKVSFKKNDVFNPLDSLVSSVETNKFKGLKSVEFKKPVHVSQAIDCLMRDEYLSYKLLERLHSNEELEQFKNDLSRAEKLKNTKIKKLYAIGNFALAFETTDDKILKITNHDHFKGRKPAFFDLPIVKQGKSGYTHYYLEEKVSQDNISQEELRAFVKEIKSHGYKMKDYLLHYTPDKDEADAAIKIEQFGKTKDGKLYLIDPACTEAPPKHFFNPKSIKDKFSVFFRRK